METKLPAEAVGTKEKLIIADGSALQLGRGEAVGKQARRLWQLLVGEANKKGQSAFRLPLSQARKKAKAPPTSIRGTFAL